MKQLAYIICFLLCFQLLQGNANNRFKELRAHEDTLQVLGDSIINGSADSVRAMASYMFIKQLATCLRIDSSFFYPFDSVKRSVSIIYPKDSSFRIFSWQVNQKGTFRFYGAIQLA
ncbi:MAG: hypothetical protein IH946_03885, partial [Bacteroidetes bacterium]|nr:hypothetical protein [Bacteroidota bacterium]